MNFSKPVRQLVAFALVVAAGWWLFADTVRYHLAEARPANVIRFAHFGSHREHLLWKEIIDDFERAHPDIHIKQEYVVGFYGFYDTKLRQQFVADVAPDVMLLQDEPFPSLAGKLAVLDEFLDCPEYNLDLRAAFHETAWRSFEAESKVRGLPVAGGNLLIYLNLDCLARAEQRAGHLPVEPSDDWTLDEFRRLAEALTCDFDDDGKIDQFGLWQPWWVYYLPFIYAFGGQVLDETRTEWRLNDAAALEAFRFYQDLLLGRRVCPLPAETGQQNQDIAFLTGKVAVVVNGPWFVPFLAQTSLKDRYRIYHIPKGPGGRGTRITWDGICMNDKISLDRKKQAWQFMRFVCSRDVQDRIAASGRVVPARLESTTAFNRGQGSHGEQKFVEAFGYSRRQPITVHFNEMDRAIKTHLRALLSPRGDQISPEEFLTRLANDERISSNFRAPVDPELER